MDMIKDLFNYTGMSIKGNYWDSYDDMNKVILENCLWIDEPNDKDMILL